MTKALHTVVLVGLLLFGRASPAAEPVILVLGDSLSAAYGIDVNAGWVALLQKRLTLEGYPHQVINASISGETTGGAKRRLPELLRTHQPALVVVELGANDGLRGIPLLEIRRNFQLMLNDIIAAHAWTVVLRMRLPPNYGPDYTQGFDAIYSELADAPRHVTVAPFFLAHVALDPSLLQADGLHPTAAAQPAMLESVWPSVKPNLTESQARLQSPGYQ